MAVPTLSIFTGTENLGTIYSVENNINVKFLEGNIPGTGTTGRFSWQIGGKTRVITIQGAHSGAGFTGSTPEEQQSEFIYQMEEWINANIQDTTIVTFTDKYGFTYTVDAVDWTWKNTAQDPSRVLYSIILKEA